MGKERSPPESHPGALASKWGAFHAERAPRLAEVVTEGNEPFDTAPTGREQVSWPQVC